MKFYITGDTHGDFSRFNHYADIKKPIGMIVLGDFGINYYLSKRDRKNKTQLNETLPNVIFYVVRGNHEARPESLITMKQVYDVDVQGNVWMEDEFPNIRYLQDGNVYTIGGKKALVLGGAYSVDKEYRLANGWQWFPNEQLNVNERDAILSRVEGEHFDLILSHTCPYPWQPFDLFLPMIDQSKVDNSMEHWMETLSHKVSYNLWCFGHFHQDRQINYFSQMMSTKIYNLDRVFKKFKRKQKRLSK